MTYDASLDWMGGWKRYGFENASSTDPLPLSTAARTIFEPTGAACKGTYRRVRIHPDDLEVERETSISPSATVDVWAIGFPVYMSPKGDSIRCPAKLHLYDPYGNHVGWNESGTVDFDSIEQCTLLSEELDSQNSRILQLLGVFGSLVTELRQMLAEHNEYMNSTEFLAQLQSPCEDDA